MRFTPIMHATKQRRETEERQNARTQRQAHSQAEATGALYLLDVPEGDASRSPHVIGARTHARERENRVN